MYALPPTPHPLRVLFFCGFFWYVLVGVLRALVDLKGHWRWRPPSHTGEGRNTVISASSRIGRKLPLPIDADSCALYY